MKHRIPTVTSALLPAVAMMVVPLAARARPVCEARNAGGRDSGELIGRNLVDQAWFSVGEDPLQLEQFRRLLLPTAQQTLREALVDDSDFIICRTQGMLDGIKSGLEEIQRDIGQVCLLDGQFWGALSAASYCALSIALDGLEAVDLEPPEPSESSCGSGFQAACRGEFESVAVADRACRPYVEDPHAALYEARRNLSCSF